MLYDVCAKHSIPHRNCGKWIIAQTDHQWEECIKVHNLSRTLGVPTHFVSPQEAKDREPDVRAKAGVLESPSTGIVDSHALMMYLQASFEDRGGDIAFNSNVVRIESTDQGRDGWTIIAKDSGSGEETAITSDTLINSAGLGACDINNMILPPARHRTQYYCKGNYYSYTPPSPRPKTLLYPAPEPGHGGLGTHLTFDMAGRIRFGPDVEWVDSADDLRVSDSPEKLARTVETIQEYLPSIKGEELQPDYVGIRPKLTANASGIAAGKGFVDFVIQTEEGYSGFVNLLGIESPGLTCSLAIAELVEEKLYRLG
jgi:L-2-hydroxyglutarate oxidase LhgO